jgi:hypothetical protein
LLRLRAEEQRHYEELREMLMKSDPYTPPAPQVRNEKLERQKHEWLAQQKGEWFERQQAEWEAKGKLIPWAGWEGELEYQWTVNELPSLELAWERRVAEEEIAEEEASTHKASFLR